MSSLGQSVVYGVMPALLLAIVVLLSVGLLQRHRSGNESVRLITHAVEELVQAARHHADVESVLALMDTFEERPELIMKLNSRTKQLGAAAILHRADSLAAQMSNVDGEQTRVRKLHAEGIDQTDRIRQLEQEYSVLWQLYMELTEFAKTNFGQTLPVKALAT
jgi:hypothetical protein